MINSIRANDSGSSAGASASGSGPEGRGFNSRLPELEKNKAAYVKRAAIIYAVMNKSITIA